MRLPRCARNDGPLPRAAGLNNPVIRLRQGLRRDKQDDGANLAMTGMDSRVRGNDKNEQLPLHNPTSP
ncbi:MAG: hypothetical protein PHY02_03000 [Phycisphaerae bacterium]|nr:hypothetical protein [Phycisphaerae bacterium]